MVIPEEKLSEMYTILKSIPHRQVEEMQRQVMVTMSNEEKTTLRTTYLKSLTLVAVFGSRFWKFKFPPLLSLDFKEALR